MDFLDYLEKKFDNAKGNVYFKTGQDEMLQSIINDGNQALKIFKDGYVDKQRIESIIIEASNMLVDNGSGM